MSVRKSLVAVAAMSMSLAANASVFNVLEFGAKGDGVAKDTAAVQKAVDAANAAGGGEVLLPKGTYLCGSVFLKSGVDFHLADGAVLKGSPEPADYNAVDVAPQNSGRLGAGDNASGGHLLLCIEQKDVTLRGPGKIDGNSGAFLKMPDGSHPKSKLEIPWRPSQMVWFVESQNVAIRDIELADAPYWSCFVYGCEDVTVERANIHTVRKPHTYNGDGLDIDSSRRVRVTGCTISTADDSITLRADGARLKRAGDCAEVTVSNCTFSSDCNAIRLGVGNGRIRDCSFGDIRIENTRYAVNAVGAWSRPEHGADISRISFENMEIDAKGFCKFYYKMATESVFDGITFRHVRGKVREPSIFDDTPTRPFRNLRFEDVRLDGETSSRVKAPSTAESVAVALTNGTAFLLSRQAEDGHWSDPQMPALTALPLWALTCAGAADAAESCRRAAAFVLSTQRPDGGFYVPKPGRGGSGLGNYNTSVCLAALFDSGLAPKSAMLRARAYIASSQLTGDDTMAGGFGYDKVSRRRYADLSNTAYAMDAMARTASLEELRSDGSARADLDWEKALKFIDGLMEKDGPDAGGAAYNERTPQAGTSTNAQGRVHLRAYGSMTYAAVLSMCAAKLDRGDPRVRQSLEYLATNWTVDENPGMGSQGLYYFYDIMARALSAAKVDEVGGHAWRKELAAKVVSLQKPDGSWSNDNNRFWEADPVLCTSFAMIVLALCR
ncbi:MAG: hypothetical protein IKF72_09355 [Kiritimatiellae bacterium]|nr:hypothetical protein [Kiritimatiellia bacterium]